VDGEPRDLRNVAVEAALVAEELVRLLGSTTPGRRAGERARRLAGLSEVLAERLSPEPSAYR
jgi:hypothetical protein